MNTPKRSTPLSSGPRRPNSRRTKSGNAEPTTSSSQVVMSAPHIHAVKSLGSMHSATPQKPLQRQMTTPRLPRRPASSASMTMSPSFAGSKFTDSPMARHVPIPPNEWLSELAPVTTVTDKVIWRCSPTPSSSSGHCSVGELSNSSEQSDAASVVSSDSGIQSSIAEMSLSVQDRQKSIRIHPLQLIAAVASV